MLSYLKKFVMDILPSVAATIIGAYIVNHYIVAKPEAPAAAAVTAAVDPKADPKAAAKPAAVVSSLPEAGVKAKGMSERTLIERSASEKATVTEKPAEKSADPKSADAKPDAPADTASIPADTRHHPAAPKAVAKVTPAAPQPAAPAASAAPVETAVTPEESRDANDLARAAIERLRKERPQEAARSQDATRTDLARLPEAQRPAATSAIRPLPPPIMVSSPSTDKCRSILAAASALRRRRPGFQPADAAGRHSGPSGAGPARPARRGDHAGAEERAHIGDRRHVLRHEVDVPRRPAEVAATPLDRS
ncbi:hypothetical protein ACVII1_007790 [Bradyrhizobium elkanii]